jgi:Flp pilus assembly protein TadD
VAAIACLVGTVRRNATYQTDVAVWTDAADKRPQNPRAWNNLGAAYSRLGQVDEERACYEVAIKLGSYSGRANLGLVLCREGRYAEAVPHLAAAIRSRARNPWRVYHQLGAALMRLGRVEEATPHLAEAARLAPDDAGARASYGFALLGQGRAGQGVAELREALRLNPTGSQEMSQLAWVLATRGDPHRDPGEAVRLAEAARDATGGADPAVLDTLAAAYADAGRTDDAVRVGLQAEELAAKAGNPAMSRTFRQRVDACYRAGLPFREGPGAVGLPPTAEQREARITEP